MKLNNDIIHDNFLCFFPFIPSLHFVLYYLRGGRMLEINACEIYCPRFVDSILEDSLVMIMASVFRKQFSSFECNVI